MPTVSLVILNYNTPDLVYDCLDSVETYLEVEHELIVVDNGCQAKLDPERLKNYPSLKHLVLEKNRGFGGGNNAGAELASGDYLWFLNSDTLLADRSLNQLFETLKENPQIGAITPLLYNDRAMQELQPDFFAYFQTLPRVVLRKIRPELNLSEELFPVDVIVGASLILPTHLFRHIGGFDPKIFMYMEDDDLCYRLKKAGKQVVIYTRAQLIHLQGKSIKRNEERKKLYYTSQDYFWRKHYGFLATLLMRLLRFPYRFYQASKT